MSISAKVKLTSRGFEYTSFVSLRDPIVEENNSTRSMMDFRLRYLMKVMLNKPFEPSVDVERLGRWERPGGGAKSLKSEMN